MALSETEREQALSIAKGMLLAQRDNMSMAGSLVNNPHFTSIPHQVKMEALRHYSRLENEDPYRTSVNIEPDRAEVARAIAKSSLREGLISLPVSAVAGIMGGLSAFPDKATPFDRAADLNRMGHSKVVNRYARRALPIAGAVFVANAAVGGIRESLKQKARVEEARDSNKYLGKIRSATSDEEMNAMLFGATPGREYEDKLKANLDRLTTNVKRFAEIGGPVISDDYIFNQSATYPYKRVVEIGEGLDQEYQDALSKQSSYSYTPTRTGTKTSAKQWKGKTTLRNTSSHPTFAAKSVKIRNSGEEKYESAFLENLSNDKDAQYRLGKAMVRKFLRI